MKIFFCLKFDFNVIYVLWNISKRVVMIQIVGVWCVDGRCFDWLSVIVDGKKVLIVRLEWKYFVDYSGFDYVFLFFFGVGQ